jgi:hypothetical protein
MDPHSFSKLVPHSLNKLDPVPVPIQPSIVQYRYSYIEHAFKIRVTFLFNYYR